ncbi:hypothetical protein ACP4B2_27525 [Streptomyces rochei]|uniref:hypothetical protein n=1 Tax=Streptomyces TaxID=1883 RepID=UPI001BA6DFDC|nr:hypothetical protein [Streptomyces alfalfae]QUI34122.1 hypothetical protein H9W91_27130 [Streptomyces alfalfae]
MEFKRRTLGQIAEMICGNGPDDEPFVYRSSKYLTQFFSDAETDFEHDGTTRALWVTDTLIEIMKEPPAAPGMPPESFLRVIDRLMDLEDAVNEENGRDRALAQLNSALKREHFEAFYGEDGKCYLRNITTAAVSTRINPHRPFSAAELVRRTELITYLNSASEDEITEDLLLPLFRQLGFQRITAAGHRDKALEYGKDVWMKYVLPTTHVLYFGIQVKKGKLDASGVSRSGNANVAEILNQVTMMIGHEIFDPEIGKRVLVDHAYIIAGGEITKAARNWLGNALDASQRRSVIFMDRDDILNLYVVNGQAVPELRSRRRAPSSSTPPF